MQKNILDYLRLFEPISLIEMEDVSLLQRTDTKFIISSSLLPGILEEVQSEYRILSINDEVLMNYRSLYFDTPENKFYLDHHRGKIKRTKIRIREYVDSKLSFFEIKIKDGRGNTDKKRIPISEFKHDLANKYLKFITDITTKSYDLSPKLYNSFQRITLANIERRERATIDINLTYSQLDKEECVPNLCIIELKQERFDRTSPLAKVLRKHQVSPYGFSKYCIGMTKIYKDLKYNAFKPKLLRLQKITA